MTPLSSHPLDPSSLCRLGPCILYVPTVSPRSPLSLDLCVLCILPCIPHAQITCIQAPSFPHDLWSPCLLCLVLDMRHRVGNKPQGMDLGMDVISSSHACCAHSKLSVSPVLSQCPHTYPQCLRPSSLCPLFYSWFSERNCWASYFLLEEGTGIYCPNQGILIPELKHLE